MAAVTGLDPAIQAALDASAAQAKQNTLTQIAVGMETSKQLSDAVIAGMVLQAEKGSIQSAHN